QKSGILEKVYRSRDRLQPGCRPFFTPIKNDHGSRHFCFTMKLRNIGNLKEASFMKGSAVFDKERKYRYSLKRTWDEGSGKVVFILLNPGPADEDKNDKTTEKCISFAKSFGYGSMEIVNLFAYITTDVSELKLLSKEEAVGKDNDNYLIRALNSADK